MTTLEARVQALLDLVEADRARRCDAITRDGEAGAAATLAAARSEAHSRMRAVFAEERNHRDARIAAAQAKLQTHRRRHEQRRAMALLAAGWQKLPEVLCERWRQPEARRTWVGRVVSEARAAFPGGPWQIVHATGWPDVERNALNATLARELGAAAQLLTDDSIRAGLKIAAGGNLIDGTLPGLLADRTEISARLLQHLETAQ